MISTDWASGVDLGKRFKALQLKRSGLALGLQGAAGIGKTHTAQALLRQTPCPSFSLHSTASLKQWLVTLPKPKTLELWAERILERLAAGEPLATADTANALGTLLARLAPVVLYLEDIHEASPERLELIVKLAVIAQRSKGVGLLLTSRNPLPEPIETIQLEPLSAQDCKPLLETHVGAELPKEALDWVYTKAAGNPLFTLEYFHFLARQGFVWNDGVRWRWRVPERQVMPITVEAIIERAITEACTDTTTRTALNTRAYLESLEPNLKLQPSIWAQVAGLEPEALERAEQSLQAQGILNASGFVHPLFREVPVKGMNAQDRKLFANQALEVLPLEVAAVFVVDAQLGPKRSLELLSRAAEASNTPGRWLALAVEFASGTQRAQLALEAARELTSTDLQQAQKLYRLALEGNSDPAVMLEFVTFLAPHQPNEAKAFFEALPADVRTSEQGLVARFQMMVVRSELNGIVNCWQDEFGSSSDLSPDALVHVMQSLLLLDRCDDAIRLADRVLTRSDLSTWQQARVMNRKYNTYGQSNHSEQALELTHQVLELLASQGLPGRDMVLSDRAMYRTQLGDLRAARTDYEEALGLTRAVGRTSHEMGILYALGELHIEFGEYALAEEFLLEAFDYLVRHPSGEMLCDTVHALIELYIAWQGRPSSGLLAQKYAHLSLEYANTTGFPAYLAASRTFAGWVELEYGSPTRALELAHEALGFRATDHQFYGRWFPTWLEAKAHSQLGDQAQALGLLEQAITGFGQIGRVVQVNLAGLDLDRLHNDLESARGRLDWFRERGMINAVNQGLRLFPELISDTIEASPKTRAIPQLQVLGSMQMRVAGTLEPVRGGKRKGLLALLLEARIAGRHEVSKLDLLEALYPDTNELQASTSLKDIVYQMRELYGPSSLQTTEGGYALGEIGSDAEVFLQTGDTRLWRGVYLEGMGQAGDDTVHEALHLNLYTRAVALLQTDPTEAARLGDLLCKADPYSSEHLHLYMQALHIAKNHMTLTRTYARAKARMSEVGETLPEHWKTFLNKNP